MKSEFLEVDQIVDQLPSILPIKEENQYQLAIKMLSDALQWLNFIEDDELESAVTQLHYSIDEYLEKQPLSIELEYLYSCKKEESEVA